MKEKVYVDRLFAAYADTSEIRDFKEEIAGNLKEHVSALVSQGLSEEEAFEKATAKLGDVTAMVEKNPELPVAPITPPAEPATQTSLEAVDPAYVARFGVESGALWVAAVAIFLAWGFIFGWQYSWILFPFTLAIQLFKTAKIFGKKR